MNKQNENFNNFFSPLENTRPYLKMAFQGFPKSGKTFTAVQIAIGLHKKIKSTKPIIAYDTEKALKALIPHFKQNNVQVLTRESRSLADLVTAIEYCKSGAGDILLIDSITHVWEAFVEAYKKQKNRTQLQFQDWGTLKPKWKQEFSDRLVMSNIHIIFTGRAGFEYDYEQEEGSDKKTLIKSGIKMKSETETAYEPDMLVTMEKFEDMISKKKKVWREAFVSERTDTIDGKVFKNPTYKDFEPAINILLNGTSKDATTSAETTDKFDDYDKTFGQNKIDRTVCLEKVEAILVQIAPGSTAPEKKLKVDILEKVFDTPSWTAIEKLDLTKLKDGVKVLELFKPNLFAKMKENVEQGHKTTPDQIIEVLDDVKKSGGNIMHLFIDEANKESNQPKVKEYIGRLNKATTESEIDSIYDELYLDADITKQDKLLLKDKAEEIKGFIKTEANPKTKTKTK